MLTNELNLPQPFVDAARSNHSYKPKRYSVTELLGGTCEAVLKRRHAGEQDEDVSDRVWAIFGTAVHKVLEQAEPVEGQMREKHMRVGVGDGYELSGVCDLFDENTETVTDWKTTSVWSVLYKDYEAWRKQLLMYCYMLVRKGYKARKGEIVALMRDHSMRTARLEADYPKHPVARLEWEFTGDDVAEVEREIEAWFEEVKEQERRSDDELVPCNPQQRWSKPEKWAVMRNGQKKAVRVFESRVEALEHMEWLANAPANKGRALRIEHRPGEDVKCRSYCSVSAFCPHLKKSGEEKLAKKS